MTRTRRTLINRRAAAILAATLTVGATGSAAARPFDLDSAGSFVPAGTTTAPPLDLNMGGFPGPGPAPAGGWHPTGNASTRSTGVARAEYVVIGAGGATVALVGVGAVGMATRRRHRPAATAQPTIAA